MTKTRKTLSTAIAFAVIATSGFAALPSSASAAGLARLAPIESTAGQATKVGYHGGYYGGNGYGYVYQPRCWWTKRKVWSYYGWHWQKVRVCR
ncbi:MAG: hypothetical protein KDJ90_07450 [Nitratireductor sp.]|nr:hypothetical protein [Nitratireductor sp.]